MRVSQIHPAARWAPLLSPLERRLGTQRADTERAQPAALLRGTDEVELSGSSRRLEAAQRDPKARESESGIDERELSPDEQEDVRKLAERDREVRAHEQAHKAAAGQLATGPSYSYERGPDGKSYAVDGEVRISVREGDTPEETLRLAQQAQRAAQAPGELSAADQAVAAKAAAMATEARKAIQEERREEQAEQKRAQDANGATSPARLAARSLDIIA
jgi:hypothetical protein